MSRNCRRRRGDAYCIAKDEQPVLNKKLIHWLLYKRWGSLPALLQAEFRERNLLRMIVIFGRMDEVEGLNTSAELCRERKDVGQDLGFAFPCR
jgi:hypothetical protein